MAHTAPTPGTSTQHTQEWFAEVHKVRHQIETATYYGFNLACCLMTIRDTRPAVFEAVREFFQFTEDELARINAQVDAATTKH